MVAGVSTATVVTSIAIPQAATATIVVAIEAHDVRRRRLNWREDLVSKILCLKSLQWASQVALVVKNTPANAWNIREVGLIPEWGRYPRGYPRRGYSKPIPTEWYVRQTTGIVGLIFQTKWHWDYLKDSSWPIYSSQNNSAMCHDTYQ